VDCGLLGSGNASESQAVGLSTPGAIAGGGPVCGEGAIPGVRMTLSLDPAGANRSVVQNVMPTSNPPILHGPYPPTTPCPTSVCQLQQQQPPLLPRPYHVCNHHPGHHLLLPGHWICQDVGWWCQLKLCTTQGPSHRVHLTSGHPWVPLYPWGHYQCGISWHLEGSELGCLAWVVCLGHTCLCPTQWFLGNTFMW
jgi:hypothetical protein